MRTTVDIEDALLERAKRLALKEKQPLGAVVNQALAAYLGSRRQASKDPPFELLVAGSARGRFPTLAEIAAIEEEEDTRTLAIPERKRDAAP
jgi:predicted transcriptional regulator